MEVEEDARLTGGRRVGKSCLNRMKRIPKLILQHIFMFQNNTKIF